MACFVITFVSVLKSSAFDSKSIVHDEMNFLVEALLSTLIRGSPGFLFPSCSRSRTPPWTWNSSKGLYLFLSARPSPKIGFGPDDRRLHDVASREDFSSWALALYVAMYDGTEVEDVCNTCAASREPGGYLLFPEFLAGISSELSVGQEIPLAGGGR